jgi:flagellar biosynthesis/type III secretory pathway protein FliH
MATDIKTYHSDTYQNGYSKGFHDGYIKALEEYTKAVGVNTHTSIIVTTKENYEQIKQQIKND